MNFRDLQWGGGQRTPRLILQTETAECGLACLAMIAGVYGLDTDLSALRARNPVSLKGISLAQLIKVASMLGLQSRALRLDIDSLPQLALPCVLHWDLRHFVVLSRVNNAEFEILDPARGRRTVGRDELSRYFTGVALEISPGATFTRRKERSQLSIRSMIAGMKGFRQSIARILGVSLAMELFSLTMPFFSQWVIDDVLVTADSDLLVVLVWGIILVGAFQVLAAWIRGRAALHLTTMLSLHWSGSTFAHLLRLPVTWFEKRHLGDVVSRFGSISSLQQTVTSGLVGAIIDGMMASLTLVVMLIYSKALTAIAFSALLLYALVRALRYETLRSASGEQIVRAARQQSFFMESVRGIQPLKLFNREEDRLRRFMNLTVETANSAIKIQSHALNYSILNSALVILENALVLFMGARFVLEGALSTGMLIAFLSYKAQFVSRASALVDQALSLRMLGLQTERLADIVLAKTEPESSISNQAEPRELNLEMRNVRFRYAQGEPWVLDGVSLKIEHREAVAIAGPSGCGKTTLLKVLLGQLIPEEGEVLIGGVPLHHIGLRQCREWIGVVMQDDRLFAGTVGENICMFDNTVEQGKVSTAARLAAVEEDIRRMPMGYDTLVGDMGTSLSGGQRQRVLLARALYKNPKLLLLDEATSHLDAAAEDHVNEALKSLSMTRIVIAHRPQTIRAMQRVIYLKDGRVELDRSAQPFHSEQSRPFAVAAE